MELKLSPDLFFVEKIRSRRDKTEKYIFLSRGQVIEFSYIDKDDGKDIICAPTQTACNLGCQFCFLSDYDLVVRNLRSWEIMLPIKFMIEDLALLKRERPNKVFLLSFMGCGEPLLNSDMVIDTCHHAIAELSKEYKTVRFAVASLIPSMKLMIKFTETVKAEMIPIKFHLSLHGTNDQQRKKIMPSASPIMESISLLEFFKRYTQNSVELHYALISNVNDSEEDLSALPAMLKYRDIPVKFLVYNQKPSINFKSTEHQRVEIFQRILGKEGITTEFYDPPGSDIGSSCGQFLMHYYEKYNKANK